MTIGTVRALAGGVSLAFAIAGCREPAPQARTTNTPQTREAQDSGVGESARDAGVAEGDGGTFGVAPVPGAGAPVAGPTGTIEGTVYLDGPIPAGDPIELPAAFLGKRGCPDAARRYAQPFDITTPGPLGGVLVAVEARAPGLGPVVTRRIVVRDCDVTPRFVFAKENDIIELESTSRTPHLPVIVGSGESINQLLLPGQSPRRLVFPQPGEFPLTFRDLPEFVGAMIYRLRQRFIDTTDVAGHYRITDVPVGTVNINAWIPGARPSQLSVVVTAGQTARQDFHLLAAPRPRQPVQGIRHNDGTVRTPSGQIIPQ